MTQQGRGKKTSKVVAVCSTVFEVVGVNRAVAILRDDLKPVMPLVGAFAVLKVILVVTAAALSAPPPAGRAEAAPPESAAQGAKVPWPLPPAAPPLNMRGAAPLPQPAARKETVAATVAVRATRPETSTPVAGKVANPPLLPPAPAKAPALGPPERPRPVELAQPQPPAPPAPVREVEVEVSARLENFRVPDSRPLLALEEVIELAVGGRTARISVGRRGPWQARESLALPEGEHRYTLRSVARARCFPEGGGWPFALTLTGGGTGKLRVKQGTRVVLKREGCQGRYYPTWLEVAE